MHKSCRKRAFWGIALSLHCVSALVLERVTFFVAGRCCSGSWQNCPPWMQCSCFTCRTHPLNHPSWEHVCILRISFRLLFLADLCRAENSAVTRMTAENLAVVFTPGLMASNVRQMSMELAQMENRKRVVISLILAVQAAMGWTWINWTSKNPNRCINSLRQKSNNCLFIQN